MISGQPTSLSFPLTIQPSFGLNGWGSVPWTPADLTTALWLDAKDAGTIVLNGSTVSQWSDKSGNDRHATQDTAANQPTYTPNSINGQPALTFGGSPVAMVSSGGTYDDPVTVYVVARLDTQSGFQRILTLGVSADLRGFFGAVSGNLATFFGNGTAWNDTNANTPNVSVLTNSILGVVNAGAAATPFVDGVAQNDKVGTMASATGIRIGRAVGATQFWIGPIGEIVICDAALSTSDRQKLEGYLAHGWGLTANLDASHPYKTAPPTV
jgi:hypothetical protein